MKFIIITIILSLILSDFSLAQPGGLDISNFGGKPNSDIAQALTTAWTQACASTTPTKIVIPAGTYQMGVVDVKGPCKAPIEIQVDGTIQAPPDPGVLNGASEWFKVQDVSFLTISGSGVFDGQGAIAWKQNNCAQDKNCKMASRNFGFNSLNNSIIRDVTSKDSKSFNVNVLGCNNLTFDGFKINTLKEGPNTDGIHIGRSTDVKVINCNIGTGDDCVSLGHGSKNITVQNVNCGPGHGISIGSLGEYPDEQPVAGVLVKNCTLTETDNGVRIKTWPNSPGATTVTDIHFEDITMVNVNNPIVLDQEYCPRDKCDKQVSSKIKISQVSFKNIKGTSKTAEGMTLICSSGVPCEGVEIADVDLTFNGAPVTAKCANVKPIITGKAPACAAPAA